MQIVFEQGPLNASEQAQVAEGFRIHSEQEGAPDYRKAPYKWLCLGENENIKAALTADVLWDWMYIDELWVSPDCRGNGMGRELMERAEVFAASEALEGLWLWTQSWQAETFYRQLGYEEFTRFENFPRGHSRIGLRKTL